MKNLKTFEKFSKINEDAWMQDMEEIEELVNDGKKVLLITTTKNSPEIEIVSVEEAINMSKKYDVVVLEDYPNIGGNLGGLDTETANRITIIAVDLKFIDEFPYLPNTIKLGTVGYNL